MFVKKWETKFVTDVSTFVVIPVNIHIKWTTYRNTLQQKQELEVDYLIGLCSNENPKK